MSVYGWYYCLYDLDKKFIKRIDFPFIAEQDGYGSYSWNLQFYTHKNTIGPYNPCGLGGLNSSSVSFYIPDENWLEQALQLKKQRDSYAMSNFAGVKLSANAEEFLNELALLEKFKTLKNKWASCSAYTVKGIKT